jgi:hypothetical protein
MMVPASTLRGSTRVRVSRWRVLVAGLFCEICGGSIYIVSLYSAQFQRLWYPNDPDGLRKIESMIFAANLGNWLPFAGFFYDDPTYGGPRNAVLVGVLLTLVGYGGLFLCAVHDWRGSSPSTALLHALWFLWGHGSGYFDCASISTNAFNFPDARGSAVGLVGSFYGLSGSVLTKVYAACFAAPARSAPAAPGVRKLVQLRLPGVRFVGFLAVGLSVLGAAMAPLMARVNFTPPMIDAEGPRRRFQLGFSLVVSLALMNAAVGMLPPSVAPPPMATLAITLLWIAPLPMLACNSSIATIAADENEEERAAINTTQQSQAVTSGARSPRPPPPPPSSSLRDDPVSVSVSTSNFWLLFVAFFFGTGGGLVLVNHVE